MKWDFHRHYTNHAASPSLRGRGLKCNILCPAFVPSYVALFARAWIEIFTAPSLSTQVSSPSLRGRGLKSRLQRKMSQGMSVALFARAWIEIGVKRPSRSSSSVALFARAWIEISSMTMKYFPVYCRPLHEGVD